MTVKDIIGDVDMVVGRYLLEHGYDGLCNADGDCACVISNLAPCGDMQGDCVAGYYKTCDCGDHDFHIKEG